MERSPKQQYLLVKRMIDEGHALGNHGYDHDPATRRGYKSSTTSEVKKDFLDNHDKFVTLFSKHKGKFTGFTCARLPGDGRFMHEYVAMIANEIKLPHVGWNVEFSTNGLMGHLKHKDWQGIKGVAGSRDTFPASTNIILMHDRHWRGKDIVLTGLIKQLKKNVIFQTLTPVPSGHSVIKYPK